MLIEKNSRIDLKELAVILGVEEIDVVNELAALEAEVKAEIEAAVEFAKQSPYPTVDQVTLDVYANDNERSVMR